MGFNQCPLNIYRHLHAHLCHVYSRCDFGNYLRKFMWMDNGHTDGWILGPQVRETQKNEKKRKKSVTVYRMLLELMFALPMYTSESILSTYWVLVEESKRHVSLLASGNKKEHMEMILKKLFL